MKKFNYDDYGNFDQYVNIKKDATDLLRFTCIQDAIADINDLITDILSARVESLINLDSFINDIINHFNGKEILFINKFIDNKTTKVFIEFGFDNLKIDEALEFVNYIECDKSIITISKYHIGVYAYDILKYHYGFDDKLCEIFNGRFIDNLYQNK